MGTLTLARRFTSADAERARSNLRGRFPEVKGVYGGSVHRRPTPHFFFPVGFFFEFWPFDAGLPREAVFAAATCAALARWSVTGADFFPGFFEWGE